jgi:hypothetical protein
MGNNKGEKEQDEQKKNSFVFFAHYCLFAPLQNS